MCHRFDFDSLPPLRENIMVAERDNVTSAVDTTRANAASPVPLEAQEVRGDRWVALLFVLFGVVFALFLLWEPISCWLRR
jgi:hypothetical protein